MQFKPHFVLQIYSHPPATQTRKSKFTQNPHIYRSTRQTPNNSQLKELASIIASKTIILNNKYHQKPHSILNITEYNRT